MLECATAGDGSRLGVLIHHTDADRERVYDHKSPIGKLVDGSENDPDIGWVIVDMAQDFSRIYTGEK